MKVATAVWEADFNSTQADGTIPALIRLYVGPPLVPGTPVVIRDDEGNVADGEWLERRTNERGSWDVLRVIEWHKPTVLTITFGGEWLA